MREAVDTLLMEAASRGRPVRLVPGEVLIEEGDQDDKVYVLASGSLAVSRSQGNDSIALTTIREPGAVVGEMVVLGGGRRTATVTAEADCDLVALTRSQFETLLGDHPQLARGLASLAVRRAEESELADLLASHFGLLDENPLATVMAAVEWGRLVQGEVLFEEGDVSDAIYFVVRGRLLVSRFEHDRGEGVRLGEVGRGEVVGETGLLRGTPRTATVTALRDTVLASLDESAFLHLIEQRPRVMIQVGLKAVERLEDTSRSSPSTVVAVATAGRIDPDTITAGLAEGLAPFGVVERLWPRKVDELLDMPGVSECAPEEVGDVRLSRFLHEAEIATDHLILDVGREGGRWSRRCLGMADRALVFVPPEPTPAELDQLDRLLGDCPRGLRRMLVVVHPPGASPPTGSAALIERFGADDIVHLQEERRQHDLARTARVAAGQGNALVLSGGGGRGFAHFGVQRALDELGVPVDIVGGTSIGGILAAVIADAMSADEAIQWATRHFPKALDYTLPLVSLIKGGRIARSAEQTFGDRQIEDVWRTYFCMSTNLTASRPYIHRRGSVTLAIRATSAIPGVMPPVPHGDDLLVDGGVLNNLPIDVAREYTPAGKVVAVDVAPPRGPSARRDYGLSVSGWQALRTGRVNGKRAYPGISAVLMRSMITASLRERDRQVTAGFADCYLELDMRGISMLDFDDPAGVAQRGYEAAMPVLEAWLNQSIPD